jgi:hypothetical protein
MSKILVKHPNVGIAITLSSYNFNPSRLIGRGEQKVPPYCTLMLYTYKTFLDIHFEKKMEFYY